MSRPRIHVLATGGTIAGWSKSSLDTTDYKPGTLTAPELLATIPQAESIADLSCEQLANHISTDVTSVLLCRLHDAIQAAIAGGARGVVVTHGTSTLEETAVFLAATLPDVVPVALVGAMRPASAVSSDGPFNLLQAISLVANPRAAGRGVMVVGNDRIGSAWYVSKRHTQALDTFQAGDAGFLGVFSGIRPRFFYRSSVTAYPKFMLRPGMTLPRVDILYSHQDEDPGYLNYAIRCGAKGIVIAGTGNSSISSALQRAITDLVEQGIPVVRASHVGNGSVSSVQKGISAGDLNPQKARVFLMLALAAGTPVDRLGAFFEPH